MFRVEGKGARSAFTGEAGGHRWQRVPPTEKRGRVQTSTVTVAILDEPREHEVHIDPADLDESFTRGSGAGGQHRNKTDTAVVLLHKPSGIQVRVDGGRSQYLNRQAALGLLRAKLKAGVVADAVDARNRKRRRQVGSGMRGDKIRTVAVQRDQVTDHQTGLSTSVRKYLKGDLSDIRRG